MINPLATYRKHVVLIDLRVAWAEHKGHTRVRGIRLLDGKEGVGATGCKPAGAQFVAGGGALAREHARGDRGRSGKSESGERSEREHLVEETKHGRGLRVSSLARRWMKT